MGEDKKGFGWKLEEMAKSVEILEKTFNNSKIEIELKLNESDFSEVAQYFRIDTSKSKCVVLIGEVNFTFLKM
jgi:hypothetical protein